MVTSAIASKTHGLTTKRRRFGRLLCWLILTGVVAACSVSSGPRSIVVPSASSVATIEVSRSNDDSSRRTVTDHATIEGVIDLLVGANDGDWSTAAQMGAYPTPAGRAVLFDRAGTVLFIVWFGYDWMGARSHAGEHQENLLWDASVERQRELRSLLKFEGR